MLSDYMERMIRLSPSPDAPALGGQTLTWQEGEGFDAALTVRRTQETESALLPAAKEAVWLVHDPTMTLRQDDLVRREATGAVYRVCGEGLRAPECAGLRICQTPAERVVPA